MQDSRNAGSAGDAGDAKSGEKSNPVKEEEVTGVRDANAGRVRG